jgi:hypothetical protein
VAAEAEREARMRARQLDTRTNVATLLDMTNTTDMSTDREWHAGYSAAAMEMHDDAWSLDLCVGFLAAVGAAVRDADGETVYGRGYNAAIRDRVSRGA